MFKKRYLLSILSAICLALAVPSVANTMDEMAVNKIESVKFSLKEQPIEVSLILIKDNDFAVSGFAYSAAFEIFDYGEVAQVNSNKLTHEKSSAFTANFAVKQNQNFDRMRLAS